MPDFIVIPSDWSRVDESTVPLNTVLIAVRYNELRLYVSKQRGLLVRVLVRYSYTKSQLPPGRSQQSQGRLYSYTLVIGCVVL